MKSTTLLLPLALGLSACTYLRGARNDPRAFCQPPGQAEAGRPVTWAIRELGAAPAPRVPSASVAGRALVGTWDVLQVMTEGSASPVVARWRMRLVATDSAIGRRCAVGRPCPGDQPTLVGGARLRDGQPFDSVAASRRTSIDATAATVRFDERANTLSITFGPLMNDAGTIFGVTNVSDSLIMGRWDDGGYVRPLVERDGIRTWEREQGFFCARRVG